MTKKQKWDLLLPVRLAIKGWAFMEETKWPAVVAHAEKTASALPAELQGDAAAIIWDLKERLS
jgi:hypothetical protein